MIIRESYSCNSERASEFYKFKGHILEVKVSILKPFNQFIIPCYHSFIYRSMSIVKAFFFFFNNYYQNLNLVLLEKQI